MLFLSLILMNLDTYHFRFANLLLEISSIIRLDNGEILELTM